MNSESYNRRSTDQGHTPSPRYTLKVLRGVLGLLPVTESLPSLQHWRRQPAKKES